MEGGEGRGGEENHGGGRSLKNCWRVAPQEEGDREEGRGGGGGVEGMAEGSSSNRDEEGKTLGPFSSKL